VLGSLRSKLIAAFAFVIFLSLFLASSAFVFLLRDYQTQLVLNQLADLALPLSYQVAMLEHAGADSTVIGRFLEDQAAEVKVRLLLVDAKGVVVEDSGEGMRGQRVTLTPGRPVPGIRVTQVGIYHQSDGQDLFLVSAGLRLRPLPGDSETRLPSYSVILAVPEDSISSSWRRLAPMLSAAGAISLAVSIVVAFFLARSISGPIAQITRASEQIARGNYDQHIEASGRDEVGQLARTFNRMAQDIALSHRTLKDFLANVSHELRTPLTSIQGFAQAMQDGSLRTPEDYTEAGRIISEESERMRRLVEELLNLSRLESGQAQMERQPLDLVELLRVTVRRAQRQADEAGIAIHLAADRLPPVLGDNHWLEQVFTNLLENALRHTPPQGTITIASAVESATAGKGGSRPVASQPGMVVVRVHNTGSYIPPEDLPRIFERFYQVDKSRSNGTSGLGLSIVREVVQSHGGTVEAFSDRERGTTFVIRLPAAGPTMASPRETAPTRTG